MPNSSAMTPEKDQANEKGGENKWKCAVEMAAQAEVDRDKWMYRAKAAERTLDNLNKTIDMIKDQHIAVYAAARAAPCSVLWLSLPDDPEEQDAPLLAAMEAGDAWTTDMTQAARLAGMGYTVKRKDQHRDGRLVETVLTAEVLYLSIDRGFEMRGARELNRPNV